MNLQEELLSGVSHEVLMTNPEGLNTCEKVVLDDISTVFTGRVRRIFDQRNNTQRKFPLPENEVLRRIYVMGLIYPGSIK